MVVISGSANSGSIESLPLVALSLKVPKLWEAACFSGMGNCQLSAFRPHFVGVRTPPSNCCFGHIARHKPTFEYTIQDGRLDRRRRLKVTQRATEKVMLLYMIQSPNQTMGVRTAGRPTLAAQNRQDQTDRRNQ
ncbi:hypothetical protein ACJJTC_015638 [Scirpophaga incertulas]